MKKNEILHRIIVEGNNADDMQLLLKNIVSTVLESMNFDFGGIYLVDNSTGAATLICDEGVLGDFVEMEGHEMIVQKPHDTIFIEGQKLLIN